MHTSGIYYIKPLCLESRRHIRLDGCSLDEHKLLSDKQHAFRKWHSCETQLATVINDWAKILDNKGQVDTFILDFEKAFDTPHMKSLRVNCSVMELVVKH